MVEIISNGMQVSVSVIKVDMATQVLYTSKRELYLWH